MDLIAFDIGNSSVKVGVFDNGQMKEHTSISINDLETNLPEILEKYRAICGEQDFGASTVPLPASSVNKQALKLVERIVLKQFNQDLILVGRDFALEMPVGVTNPESLGSDRLLTASAAYDVVGRAVVVADFGTATTIDLVNDAGIFLGGVIIPGLEMSARSLNDYTSALPFVKPSVPQAENAYGINTESAINNGIYYAALGALRELVERYASELGYWPQVVATGGYARMIAERSDLIENIVPELCLSGLYLSYSRWRDSELSQDDILGDAFGDEEDV